MSSNAKKPSKKQGERPLAAAPHTLLTRPGHPLTHAKPEGRAHLAERKVKHKGRAGEDE